MNMTNEQRDFLKMIMENKSTLDGLLKEVSKPEQKIQKKQAKELKIGESVGIAGITWSKFAEDDEYNAYMLADEKICNMEFGKDNNWIDSPIRHELNEKLSQKIAEQIGSKKMISITVDLFSDDGLRDYGKTVDKVSLLTYDLYRNNRKNIKPLKNELFWTCTPDSTPSGSGDDSVQIVCSDGRIDYSFCGILRAVRPFFILKSYVMV